MSRTLDLIEQAVTLDKQHVNTRCVTFSLPQGLTVGGITTWATRLARAAADAGWDVRLVFHQPFTGHAELGEGDVPALAGVRVVRAPTLTDPLAWSSCIRTYRDLLPTILLPNVLAESYAVAAALATTHADALRVVGWNHSDNPYDYAYLSYYEPIIHRYVVNTAHCADELRRRLPTRSACIGEVPHGVQVPPPSVRAPLAGRAVRLMYAGRMEQLVKRVMDFVDLARLLHQRRLRFEMLLIGDGPLAGAVDRVIGEMDAVLAAAGSQIRRQPPVAPQAMQTNWRWADVSMLASVHEGLSMQMIEAMACGCVPVVSHVASGADEIVKNGETGFTFPVGDINTMADRIAWLTANEPAMRRMSQAARDAVQHHCDYDRFVTQSLDVLEQARASADRPWPPNKPIQMNGATESSRATVPSDAADRLLRLLHQIAGRDEGPIAIYGAGGHTRALAETWADSPVEIVGVIDDDPGRCGGRLWGWPIVRPDEAAGTGARSVVISSWMHEASIWQRRGPLEAAGLRVFGLYGSGSDVVASRVPRGSAVAGY